MNYEALLKQLVLADDRFIVMTAENRAPIRNLPTILGNRFVDVGIAEQSMVGMAAGFALRGRIPVIHALASFLTMRAFEFIRTDIGILGLPVKLVAFVPGFLSEANGPTHQAVEDVSLMRGIPALKIFCPADENDLLLGLPEVLQSPEPFYIRLNTRKSWYLHSHPFRIGKAEVVSRGTDITLLVYGTLFTEALEAKEVLEDQGYAVGLLNLRTLKPLDEAAVLEAVSISRFLVTIEDHFREGGLTSLLAELFLHRRVLKPVLSLSLETRWFTAALLPDLLEHEGFTGKQIAQRIIDAYNREFRGNEAVQKGEINAQSSLL